MKGICCLFIAVLGLSRLALLAAEAPTAVGGANFIGAPDPGKSTKPSPLTPEEERASFTLPPGFEIELVAAESEGIGKFVAIDWDLQGRLWSMTALEYPVDANENAAVAKELYASKAKDKVVVFDRNEASPTSYSPKPRVFADGLAIPLGILPYKNGVYVQHGPDIVFLSDTDGDGKADKREVILSGFGVQDSHLFPHQFTRAPGNWIWMAQGAFNYGTVRTTKGSEVKFDQTRMAKFRYDGSDFEITSQGPCNIWGLAMTAEGETWIQEANDYGYPTMPFHEYANYPGCSDAQFKSYAPEFPGTAPHFRMGGTGLSGLALTDAPRSRQGNEPDRLLTSAATQHFWPAAYCEVMYVANPITRKIQAIKIHRAGPRYRLEKLPDFVQSSDEWFRPVALRLGPDGCLYFVDWYNKIISHNEVPRNHPERDKKRGRIWRVKYKEQTPFAVPDFTKLSGGELLAKLGGESTPQSHLAWQAVTDRQMKELAPDLKGMITDQAQPTARRIATLWALEGLRAVDAATLKPLLGDTNRNIRREAVRAFGEGQLAPTAVLSAIESLADDSDPEVRSEVIRTAGTLLERGSVSRSSNASAIASKNSEASAARLSAAALESRALQQSIGLLARMAKPALAEPTTRSTHNGRTIKAGEAYEREFERYLVRMFLERHSEAVATFLESEPAKALPIENRLVATLALAPRTSATRVAHLIPQLTRPPGQEELLRLAQFPDEPGVSDALKAILRNVETRAAALESLLKVRTRLDAAKLTPLLTDAARQLLAQGDSAAMELGVRLASAFQLASIEPDLVRVLKAEQASHLSGAGEKTPTLLLSLRALREIKSSEVELFASLLKEFDDPVIQSESAAALAASRDPRGPTQLASLYPMLSAAPSKTALAGLSSTKPGAQVLVKAIRAGTIAKEDLDAATFDKLHAVLGDDQDLDAVMHEMASFVRPALRLDGSDNAWVDSDITLDGPFTVETWMKLDPGINNNDGILGAPGALDMNFHDALFRVWVGVEIHDAVIAKKKISPDIWTHIAVTRDADGKFRIYVNGELDTAESKLAPQKFEHCRIGWTGSNKGTAGWLTEFRVWNRARTADEIRAEFDRSFENNSERGSASRSRSDTSNALKSNEAVSRRETVVTQKNYAPDLIFYASSAGPWGKLQGGAKVAKTFDFPSLLTATEARAQKEKFARFRALAGEHGDAAHGQSLFTTTCMVCHSVGGQGAQIGPVLNGAAALGIEALLRNILTPSAAMEPGYRVFRIELKDGEVLDGLLVSQNNEGIVLRRQNAEDLRIPLRNVKRAVFTRLSMMPEGLLEALKPNEVTDLFAYLQTLK